MLDTIARRKLAEKIDAKEITQSSLAKELGLSQPSISAWKQGKTRPETHQRQAIRRVLDIPEDDWLTDAEFVIAHGHARTDRESGADVASNEDTKEEVNATGTHDGE